MTRIALIVLAALSLTAVPAAAQTVPPVTDGYARAGGVEQTTIGGADLEDMPGAVAGEEESGSDPVASGGDPSPAVTPAATLVADAPTGGGEQATASELPFTGLNTATIVLVGGLLLLVGLTMRRLARTPASAPLA